MRKYRRVAHHDRCQIHAFLQTNFSVSEISNRLGFSRSTIYRELSRHGGKRHYNPVKASKRARSSFKRCRRKKIITSDVATHILAYAAFGWSPEQIASRLGLERRLKVSHQTIYRRYPRGEPKGHWRIVRKRSRRRSGGRATQRRARALSKLSIHDRPIAADLRVRRGDWERDGAYGANRQQVLVLTDRKTRYTKLAKMGTGKSLEVAEITKGILLSLQKRVFSITNDNGTEFNETASLPWKVYHSDPYKPQQRGTVENTVGLLREYIKRNTDLDKVSAEQLSYIEHQLNFRPRKCLGFRTPFEAFFNKNVALAMET